MKELSIEEKAKCYDKALEEAKRWHKAFVMGHNYPATDIKVSYEWIFPELKESEGEDERIKKDIIAHFSRGKEVEFPELEEKYNKWIAWLEKQGKKSVDSVMSKFNVGDWLVHNERRNIVKVVGHTHLDYEVVNTLGYHHKITSIAVENNYHLWSIKDAKDGDILFHSDSASNGIFIFKKINDRGFAKEIICYCDYDSEDHFCLGEHHTCCWVNAKILHPATNEQCSLLFQKMKEAGYTFDFEKKKLKKIEQNLAWSEANLPEFESYLCLMFQRFRTKGMCTNGEIIDYVKEYAQKLKDALYHAWSEEDERMYRGLHNLIYSTPYCDSRKELSDWLKSLKERVQPKQEWSEEDDYNLQCMIAKVTSDIQKGNVGRNNEIIDWLKSLKLKNRWKPNDEQIKVLEMAVEGNIPQPGIIQSILEQLKKLREE